jgi:hypothetical protein
VYGLGEGGADNGVAGVVTSNDNSQASAVYGSAVSASGFIQHGVAGQISPAGAGYAIYGINNSSASNAFA